MPLIVEEKLPRSSIPGTKRLLTVEILIPVTMTSVSSLITSSWVTSLKMSDPLMLAMSQSGILTDDFKPITSEPPRKRLPGQMILPKRVVRIPLPAPSDPSLTALSLKRPAPALTSDSLLEDAHKKIKLRLNNNEGSLPPRLHLRRADLSLLEPVLQSLLAGTVSKSKVFNLQLISPINLSASSASKVRVSDGKNVTDNCIMVRQNNVKLLQNPVIKVIGWNIITYQDNICLHITDFVTVKNTVDFAVIGKPVLLNNVPHSFLLPSLEEKTTFENTEVDGVLIPGSNVKSMVVRIMNNMRSHYVNDFGSFPSRAYSRPDRQIWTKT